MSHFTVLVVADDADDLENVLLPYHEFECTGINAYIQETDETEHYEEDYINNGEGESFREFLESWTGKSEVTEGEEPDTDGDHKYGYVVVNKNGDVVKVVDRTNPNAKWDWWTVGGRWQNRLTLHDSTEVNYAYVRDVDWKQMIAEDISKMKARYDSWHKAFNVAEVEEGGETHYDEWCARNDEVASVLPTYNDYYKASVAFCAADQMLDLREAKKMLLMTRDEFSALGRRATTYAFVDEDGNWNQRGEMGWFGMDDPDLATENYDLLFWEMIERLNDTDKQVFVVDCHI